jgi:hypothetical protein
MEIETVLLSKLIITIERVILERGKTNILRTDYGLDFTSKDVSDFRYGQLESHLVYSNIETDTESINRLVQ